MSNELKPIANPESRSSLHTKLEDAQFNKSLLELKDLRSQLHYAAKYCEVSFFKSKEKKAVVENTKEYVCRALVTVVDHLGTVSMGLETQISSENQFNDTDIRMSCLQQRLRTCQEYAHRLNLSKVRWNANLQRHHTRYISLPSLDLEKSSDVVRGTDDSLVPKTIPKFNLCTEKEMPLFLYTRPHKASLSNLPVADTSRATQLSRSSSSGSRFSMTLPVRDPATASIPRNPSFHFQETKKHSRNEKNRRLLQLPWRKSYRIRKRDTL